MKKAMPYWRMDEDAKFEWAYLEYLQRGHEVDMIAEGKATLSYTAKQVMARRLAVGLSCEESEALMKYMSITLKIIKNSCNEKLRG